LNIHRPKEARTANSRFAKAGVSCFYDSEVPNSSFVHLLKFSAENPRLRKAAKRWTTFHLRWSYPPKLGIEQNIVQHAFDEIGYPALRAPLRRRASSHRIALSPGLRQAPHCKQFF